MTFEKWYRENSALILGSWSGHSVEKQQEALARASWAASAEFNDLLGIITGLEKENEELAEKLEQISDIAR